MHSAYSSYSVRSCGSFNRSIACFTRSYTCVDQLIHYRANKMTHCEYDSLAWRHAQHSGGDAFVQRRGTLVPKQVLGHANQGLHAALSFYPRCFLYSPVRQLYPVLQTPVAHVLIVSIGAFEKGPIAPDTRPMSIVCIVGKLPLAYCG